MSIDEPNLVPLSVAACALGVQPRELRAEIESGGLPHARVGEKAILVDLDLIRRLLGERASAPCGIVEYQANSGDPNEEARRE